MDFARDLVGYLNIWPLPHIFYVPLKWKGSESIVSFDKEPTPESMRAWLEVQIQEDEVNNLKFI